MASAPPSFAGDLPHVGRLPDPGNPSAPLAEGAEALSRATAGAAEQQQSTNLSVAQINRQRQLQLATGTVAANLARMQGDLNVDLVALRNQPGDYGATVQQRLDKFHDQASEMLGNDPELYARFADNIASIDANARTEAAKWSAEQEATQRVTDSDNLQNALQSGVRTAISSGTFSPQMMKDADTLDTTAVRSLPIPPAKQDEMIRTRHDARLVTLIDARTSVDPHAVIDDIDKGVYGELDDRVVNQLRFRAETEASKLDTRARAAADATMGVQRAVIENDLGDVDKGTVKNMATLQSYKTLLAASNKPEDIKLAHRVDLALAENAVNAKYDAAAPADRLAAMNEIETHKNWRNDPQLVVAHTQLQQLITRDQQASQKDPISLYRAQTGQSIPALNLADPNAMQQRFILGDQAAQRFGNQVPMHFTEQEADQLRQQYNQADVAGKATLIQTLGAYGSQRAREMMFQIAPNKPELGRLAELAADKDPAVQSIVREASDGSAVPLKEGIPGAIKNEMQATYGPAFARFDGDRQKALLQVATWVYAHRAATAGKANVYDANLARQSIEAALGSANGKGGLGTRNGSPMVLPMGTSQDDFDRVMAIGTAHPDIVGQAANGTPQWAGRDLHQRDFAGLVPVLVHDDGVIAAYAFKSRGGSGYVKNQRGQDYLLDVRKLAQGLKGGSFDQQLAAHGYVRH